MSAENAADGDVLKLLDELDLPPAPEAPPTAPESAAAVAPPPEPEAPAPPAPSEEEPAEDFVLVRVNKGFHPEGEIQPVAHKRVLVVDDNDDYRETLQSLLASRGYEVYAAVDGVRGMELALEIRPDLVITDFNMPRMNGYEMVSSLRGDPDTVQTPMILFTGAQNRRQLQGLHIAHCLFLEKPFRNEVLFDAVADFIGNSWPNAAAAIHPAVREANADEAAAPPSKAKAPAASLEAAVAKPSTPAAPVEIVHVKPGVPGAGPAPRAAAEPPPPAAGGDGPDEGDLGDDASLQVDTPREQQEQENNALDGASDSPTIARVNKILVRAVKMGASDVHFECESDKMVVRYRIDGAMRQVATLPFLMRSRVAARIKVMAKLVITERRVPQDGQIRAVVAGRDVDFRVSTVPGQHGENVVMRLATGSAKRGGLKDLGLSERDLQAMERSLSVANGLVLVTGPTGSGKTTTLYTMLGELNTPENKILTAEDPVEQALPGVTQVATKAAVGLTFEKILRAFMRQDPDIILIGEIRDLETADIAIKASITGHLVLSTLHTNSAPATVVRLIQMGIPSYLLASCLRLIVAQRLVRLLCQKCKTLSDTPELDLKLLTEAEVRRVKKSWVGAGCDDCHRTGYKGRMPLFEVMPVNSLNMRSAILEGASEDRITKLATLEGMKTLRDRALDIVAGGLTSLNEAMPFIVGE